MAKTVLETHEHYFTLENPMPEVERKAPFSVYKNELTVRGVLFLAATVLSVLFSVLPSVPEGLNLLPTILLAVAVVDLLDTLFKKNQNWHSQNYDRLKFSLASKEIMEKLVSLNDFYKGRREDSVMFSSNDVSDSSHWWTTHPWLNYLAKVSPTRREKRKGFTRYSTGGVLYTSDTTGWSFYPEFISPTEYKVTVKLVEFEER